MANARKQSSAKVVDWLGYNHGDDITLTITEEDQRLGIPGSPKNCAIVQTFLHSNPNVYDAKVREGDMQIWIHGDDGKDWRGRLVMDNASRDAAIRYDNHTLLSPTKITVRMDKWHEVSHYTRAPKPSVAKGEKPANGKSEPLANGNGEPPVPPPANGEPPVPTPEPKAQVKEQTLKAKARQTRRSRWDTSYFKHPTDNP